MKIRKEGILFAAFAIAAFNLWIGFTLISTSKINGVPKTKSDLTPTIGPPKPEKNRTLEASDLPHFVLHIGPPKTATTFIQCGLHKLSKTLADFDSYYFVGKTCPNMRNKMENGEESIPGHFLIMGLNDGNTGNRGYEKLKSRMDYHRLQRHNIVYSNEAFANHLVDKDVAWEGLDKMFEGWRVRVVIGYRHYFDWIRSFYYQTHKQNDKLNQLWPTHSRGKAHPSFLSFLDYHLQRKETGDLSVDGGRENNAFGHHLTISAYNKFSSHFQDIQILDLHSENDVFTEFVCDILPGANHTCGVLKNRSQEHKDAEESNKVAKRPLQSLDAYRIAEAALDKGHIRDTSDKKTVIKMIQGKIEETGIHRNERYRACPSAALVDRLLKVSTDYEAEMLAIHHPKLSAAQRKSIEASHLALYKKTEDEGRFCEIDTDALLGDETWVQTLIDIGNQASA